ncbi:diguanylate cyclase [Desulfohalobium retbaense]|uniref:diguanylate cyclase n=1 Tax=Desulfohalobium retbaense (strain ATCC 49708 / DSM 5692 / JCM 16813 / HR100) TaxID=485915 RepID=C8X5E3_DESRD|nr:diguanylate cyclase [Desulfohalobium retbaense]ACV69640.1 diguanylate cyclase [Desulfohalobium retbaense DSM 5692]
MSDDSLFDQETQVIQEAEAIARDSRHADNPLLPPYTELLNEYKRLFRHTRRLVRMGDRMQKNLNTLNEELNAHKDVLSEMSYIDGLTGIANRRRFNETVEAEWQRGLRNNQALALVFLDLDYFKQYNDNYGHNLGDTCLIDVAKALQQSAKRCNDLVARYGGEEFVILLPDTDQEGAFAVGQKVLDNIRNLEIPHAFSPIAQVVTASVGVAVTIPGAERTPQDLIQTADAQLYAAKEAGRNQMQGRVLDHDA